MSALPVIPTSPAQRWRQTRRQVLPLAMFLGGITAIAFIWRGWVAPPSFVAEAENVIAEVRAPQAGWLAEVRVDALQRVATDEVLGHVVIADPKIVEASLAVIRAEVAFMLTTAEPAKDQQRVALDRERLQLAWMQQRVELASLRVRAQRAEADLARGAALQAKQLLNEQSFDEIRARRDELAAQLGEQERLVARLAPALGATENASASADGKHGGGAGSAASPLLSAAEALRAGMKVQEEKLRLAEAQLAPVPLRAPRAGIVSGVLRRSGEVVAAGEPVVQIAAEQSERLVGFVRAPLAFEPRPGDRVELRARGYERRSGLATITHVGTALEPLPAAALAAMRLPATGDLGLRVHLSRPEGLALRPGEPVDAVVRTAR